MGKAIKDKEIKTEEVVETVENVETVEAEQANTGDEQVDAFLNGETDKMPEDAEEITEEEAKALEEKANAEAEDEKAEKDEEEVEDGEYIIEAPNKAYTGTTATVDFKDGKGVTANKVILAYFKDRGYKITKK